MKLRLDIANQYQGLVYPTPALRRLVKVLQRMYPLPQSAQVKEAELSLVWLGDAAISQLHGAFLGDANPTDVITFAGDASQGFAGEICISVDTARRAAVQHKTQWVWELNLYLVHGWLHLVGYDDKTTSQRQRMTAVQTQLMQDLESAGHLVPFSLKLLA
jgi:probable rRNA maturation factor